MSIEKCSECGRDVSSLAGSCPHCGAPRKATILRPPAVRTPFRILGGIVVAFFVFGIWLASRSPTSSDTGGVPRPPSPTANTADTGHEPIASASAPQAQLPADEVSLLKLLESAKLRSAQATNDMEKGGIKHDREKRICGLLKSRQVNGWIGTVDVLDSDRDGKGDLSVKIADDVTVMTWNNSLSDIGDHTRIDPGTPVFAAASGLQKGQTIEFSGHFLEGLEGDCIREASLTLEGQLTKPDFIFKFDSVGKPGIKHSRVSAAPGVSTPPNNRPLEERSVDASTESDNEQKPEAAPGDVPNPTQIAADKASSPSFDCALAKSAAELLICSDTDLAREDRELAVLYDQAKALAPDKVAFARQNVAEWHRRESTCTDKDCLLAWYATRRAELSQIVAAAR